MKLNIRFGIVITLLVISLSHNLEAKSKVTAESFNIKKDLLLVQFDCKTDVDDLHTVAGLATLVVDAKYSKLKFHAIAGTYGIQEGLYVPPNPLFKLAFGDNWTDAHNNLLPAVNEVKEMVKKTLKSKGNIWIAEAGQSDFTAELIKAIQDDLPDINIAERFHVVQHSDWNEKTTTPEHLEFVKKESTYYKIADGNAVGNGTPGFCNADYTTWNEHIKDATLVEIWQLAIELSNKYNGQDGRYNNKAISAGGLDFSDLCEVCFILGISDIKDTEEFFIRFGK